MHTGIYPDNNRISLQHTLQNVCTTLLHCTFPPPGRSRQTSGLQPDFVVFTYLTCLVGRKNVILPTVYSICAIKEMTISKTKAQLVDVARQLFAKKGVEATTMNDIAVASQKGRRTLYTYFKNKEDVYMAVVESELEMLSDRMTRAAGRPTSPEKKILELIMTHLEAIKLVVFRNGTLRAYFFRNIWQVETIRKHFDQKEIILFRRVLQEGKEKGFFDIDNVDIMADILHYCIKGIEVPYIRGQIGEELDDETGWRYVSKIVYGALGCKNNHL